MAQILGGIATVLLLAVTWLAITALSVGVPVVVIVLVLKMLGVL